MDKRRKQSEHSFTRRKLILGAGAAGSAIATPSLVSCSGARASGAGSRDGRIVAAIVNVPVLKDLETMTPKRYHSEKKGGEVNFTSLPQEDLRRKMVQTLASGTGSFDVICLLNNDVQSYAAHGWLTNLTPAVKKAGPEYDRGDFLTPVIDTLTRHNTQYAIPVYGESACLMYRKDIFAANGITISDNPEWEEVERIARKLKRSDRAGLCMRGKPGESQVTIQAMIHAFGGRMFTPKYEPTFTETETREALKYYVKLARQVGQTGVGSDGFTECLNKMSQGNAAMFVDSTVAGSTLESKKESKVAGKVGYLPAPTAKTPAYGWLSSWALAIPKGADNADAAWDFIRWATSKKYATEVGRALGASHIPPGTRQSTYKDERYQEAAPYADVTLKQISNMRPEYMVKSVPPPKVPGAGKEFPEYEEIHQLFTREIQAAINGTKSTEEAVDFVQAETRKKMKQYGYLDG